jgi:hypothetical protein
MPTTPTIPAGNLFMNATTYTGNGTSLAVTNGVAGQTFQPDFVWIKSRTTSGFEHELFDVNRGIYNYLSSNSTAAESNNTATLTAFNSNGFTVGAGGYNNASGNNYVGWQWKAGGTAVSNTDGTITSSVSANQTSGFSVVTYTANGSTGTVGHGLSVLGVAPAMIIVKKRNAAERWCVFHTSTSNAYIYLNETFAAETSNAQLRFGNNSAVVQPTSSVFTIGNSNDVNGTSGTYVAYCWAPIAGYSAFGSYTGNGSADGPFVYTGFRPKWVLTKRTDTGGAGMNWIIIDTSRDTFNACDDVLRPNLSDAEVAYTTMDILSNGFKMRNTDFSINGSGATYIYAAFAETPLKFSNAR